MQSSEFSDYRLGLAASAPQCDYRIIMFAPDEREAAHSPKLTPFTLDIVYGGAASALLGNIESKLTTAQARVGGRGGGGGALERGEEGEGGEREWHGGRLRGWFCKGRYGRWDGDRVRGGRWISCCGSAPIICESAAYRCPSVLCSVLDIISLFLTPVVMCRRPARNGRGTSPRILPKGRNEEGR